MKLSSRRAAGEAGVAAIELLITLHAGQNDLLGVDHDDVIAHVDVRSVEGVQLAGEQRGGDGRKASEGLAGGVDQVPLALDVLAAGDGGSVGGSDIGHGAVCSLDLLSSVRASVVREETAAKDDAGGMSRLRGVSGAWRVGSGSKPDANCGVGRGLRLDRTAWDRMKRSARLCRIRVEH